MKKLNQSGSHIIAIALVIAVLGVIGFTGYTVMNRSHKDAATNGDVSATVPATITTQADLSATARSLDNASSQLDSNINTSSLDSSINDLL